MRILLVSNLYPPMHVGGYELAAMNVANGLAARGHAVRVLTSASTLPDEVLTGSGKPHVDRSLTLRGFSPLRMLGHDDASGELRLERGLSNFANTAAFLRQVADYEPDCIYFFSTLGLGGVALIDAASTSGVPWVLHLMDRIPCALAEGSTREQLSVFDAHDGRIYRKGRIISMSWTLIDEIARECAIDLTTAALVPGWASTADEHVRRHRWKDGSLSFIFVGWVSSYKGAFMILEAAARVAEEGLRNFRIDFYGGGQVSEGVELAARCGLSQLATFHGAVSQETLDSAYRQADALLFPTWRREPFGFAPIEAASHGCLPVMTATCGAAERFIDGVDCLKIRPEVDDLAEVMRSILVGEHDVQVLGEAAYRTWRRDLTFDGALSKIEGILDECTRQAKDARISGWRARNLAYLKHNLVHLLEQERKS